jgi:formamidopyrimidine-DNA glycosylase
MPELPEIETIKRSFVNLINSKVLRIEFNRYDIIRRSDFKPEELHGKPAEIIYRRGKYLVFNFGGHLNLIVHLGMSGRLYLMEDDQSVIGKHVHMIAYFNNHKKLIYQDARRFGGVWLINDVKGFFARLGKEPLEDDFNPQYLGDIIRNRKIPIKSLILDQHLISGIGNIYADEALFEAGIKPDRPAGSLSDLEIQRLCESIKNVLAHSIEQRGTTFRDYRDGFNQAGGFQNYLKVYGRHQQACVRCGKVISREVIGGRGSHFCCNCQR